MLRAALVAEDGISAATGGSYTYFVDGTQVNNGTVGLRNDGTTYWDSAGAVSGEVATITGDDQPQAER